ncbi:hypothetical protein SBA2_240007 [Acidobacteriia bacterium SbA2]|nr:hypothetical protein SBA2_240007 [Acidobacteriia bacterium SbA2]
MPALDIVLDSLALKMFGEKVPQRSRV